MFGLAIVGLRVVSTSQLREALRRRPGRVSSMVVMHSGLNLAQPYLNEPAILRPTQRGYSALRVRSGDLLRLANQLRSG